MDEEDIKPDSDLDSDLKVGKGKKKSGLKTGFQAARSAALICVLSFEPCAMEGSTSSLARHARTSLVPKPPTCKIKTYDGKKSAHHKLEHWVTTTASRNWMHHWNKYGSKWVLKAIINNSPECHVLVTFLPKMSELFCGTTTILYTRSTSGP